MRKMKKIAALLLAVLLLCQAMPLTASAAYFSDVPAGAWYADELGTIMDIQAQMGSNNIISGYPDGSFRPSGTLTRGQFLKMILEAEMTSSMGLFTTDTSRDKVHWAGRYYTLALENNILIVDVYSDGGEPMFSCTYAELEKPITRYEMAVILYNVVMNIVPGTTLVVEKPENIITDYEEIDEAYRTAVVQTYAKCLLTGNERGEFNGENNLTRAEAVAVIYRYLFDSDKVADFADKAEVEEIVVAPEGFQSFAQWLADGHIDAWGNLDAEAKTRLFGSPNKSYFSSASDAAAYMTTVTVPIWTMDKTGNKFSSSMPITVHKLVAQEIQLIFQEIYNDPERFPIYGGWSVGGARYTDTMRHSWGCAVDINALYNCECRMYWSAGSCTVTCGYGWWPEGTAWTAFAGSLSAPSPYSISADGSVVRAFAKYGWGWGGQGYSVQSNGSQKFDYMHFSVMPSGG